MPVSPWGGPPEPYETRLGHAHFASGVIVATVKLPDEPALGLHRNKPGILFDFVDGTPGNLHRYPPFVLTFMGDDEPPALVGVVTAAVADLDRAATWEPPKPPRIKNCPGCGVRLHGAVAERGGCLACFPELPPGGAR